MLSKFRAELSLTPATVSLEPRHRALQEPPYTNYTAHFVGTLDYIFYTCRCAPFAFLAPRAQRCFSVWSRASHFVAP